MSYQKISVSVVEANLEKRKPEFTGR